MGRDADMLVPGKQTLFSSLQAFLSSVTSTEPCVSSCASEGFDLFGSLGCRSHTRTDLIQVESSVTKILLLHLGLFIDPSLVNFNIYNMYIYPIKYLTHR